jgi:hypothetical protein
MANEEPDAEILDELRIELDNLQPVLDVYNPQGE